MKSPKFYRIYDYDKQLLPNAYVRSVEENVTNLDQAKERTGFSVGYPGWGLIYHICLSTLNPDTPNVILETGTNWGYSSIMLAQAIKDTGRKGHIHTIELEKNNFETAKNNISKGGVSEFITLYNGSSLNVLPELIESIETIHIAFLDGSHKMDDVYKEFEIIYPKLSDSSIVLFDNTYQIADENNDDQLVYGALKQIDANFGGSLINFEFVSWYTPGMAIWQKNPFGRNESFKNKLDQLHTDLERVKEQNENNSKAKEAIQHELAELNQRLANPQEALKHFVAISLQSLGLKRHKRP